jgi:hypothetical protein
MTRSPSSLLLVARWLADSVGEGGIFTKQALRAALPQFEQVDRRMRDLRSYGWRIDTYREDTQLRSGELRLVHVGAHPGGPGVGSPSNDRVSSKERVAAISAAEFRCSQCGLQLGEADDSEAGFAQLRVLRVDGGLLVTCALCAKGAPTVARENSALLEERLKKMSTNELRELRVRLSTGRGPTPVESAIALASRISSELAIEQVERALKDAGDAAQRTDFSVDDVTAQGD